MRRCLRCARPGTTLRALFNFFWGRSMSIAEPRAILGRIMVASKESPIAVFKTSIEGCLEAVFADTTGTRERVSSGVNFVGVFDQDMSINTTFNILVKYSQAKLDYD